MKTCKTCGEAKDAGEFRRRGNQCRSCYNAYQLAWYHAHREQVVERFRAKRAAAPESERAKDRAYWAAHREQQREKGARQRAKDPERRRREAREWAAANPERVKERNRRKYLEQREERIAKQREYVARQDPEVMREKKRAYYQQNRERLLEKARARYAADPERAAIYHRQRKVRRKYVGAEPLVFHTEAEWAEKLVAFGGKCAHCGTTECITRDHIVPLSKGGTDHIDNVQPLCQSCNSKKGTRVV